MFLARSRTAILGLVGAGISNFVLPETGDQQNPITLQSNLPILNAKNIIPSQNPFVFPNVPASKDSNYHHQLREKIKRFMVIAGIPGMSVGIAVNGETVFCEGFGYADVESGSECSGESVMRIASISKPITSAIAAELVHAGKLDLDRPISDYLTELEFPRKVVNGESVEITTRQLLSHKGGIRHYPMTQQNHSQSKDTTKLEAIPDSADIIEFHSNKKYHSVTESLSMFKDDNLVGTPGEKFSYTTHGFTLLSAVLEKASEKKFKELLTDFFQRLGMRHTYTDDQNHRIIVNRTKYYRRSKAGKLENVPEVCNSYKLAGGGILSNVEDLLIFANAMLYSFLKMPKARRKGFLETQSVQSLWTKEAEDDKRQNYGLGWYLCDEREKLGGVPDFRQHKFWWHSGGAVGATSVLMIRSHADDKTSVQENPKGICVAILANIQDCGGLLDLAIDLAEVFEKNNLLRN